MGLAKIDVLVLDDFAISPLTEESRRDLLEILEDKQRRNKTLTSTSLRSDHDAPAWTITMTRFV